MRVGDIFWIAGDTEDPSDASIDVYEEHPDRFWIARGGEMRGPFARHEVTRALRIACTRMYEGCELGPTQSGFACLDGARAFDPRLKQSWRDPHELPESATRYDADVDVPAKDGVLAKTWNAHPRGSRIVRDESGVTVFDAA